MNHNPTSGRFKLASLLIAAFLWVCFSVPSISAIDQPEAETKFMDLIRQFSSYNDRSAGTPGARKAAEYIKKTFTEIGLTEIGYQRFAIPVLHHKKTTLRIPSRNVTVPINPLRVNAICPGTIADEAISGPLIYAGYGELKHLNGKQIAGAVILMEFDSGKNWLHAASLGGKALIYVDRGSKSNTFFNEKLELTPIRFPRFWMPLAAARELFGSFESAPAGQIEPKVQLSSDIKWKPETGANIYGIIEGSAPKLREELIIVEAFYDSTAWVPGKSPGADEACGIVTLLELARSLKKSPPARSILLVATDAHAHTLAGMRELIWSIKERSRKIRKMKKRLRAMEKSSQASVKLLKKMTSKTGWDRLAAGPETSIRMKEVLAERMKTEVDILSRRLMRLRMQERNEDIDWKIKALARDRLVLRRLVWKNSFSDLPEDERIAAMRLVPLALKDQQAVLFDARTQRKQLQSSMKLRSLVKSKDIAAVISLHLSSHGDGVGAFNRGWLYPLKPTIDRVNAYSAIDEALTEAAARVESSLQLKGLFKDTLRPSRLRPWQSYFLDRPQLGGEISSLAGYVGITLATVNDARPLWGTPYDVPESVNGASAVKQSALVCGLIRQLSEAPRLFSDVLPRDGFGVVAGRAKFLRHGELFADQPAPGAMVLSYQHMARYYNMVDSAGTFIIKGVADKKHVLHKVIIEGYRFDPETGETIWAIDKKKTGKSAYRVKMSRRYMETDLIMFACKQTTLFNLLEPRNFRYMTKIKVLDARREAPPLRYWWSRIDTWSSTITSICLESGTRMKMTLSDSVLSKKLILTHATPSNPQGVGYLVDDWPFIHRTSYRVALDMWSLLAPRIANLENHGIYNEKIRSLQQEGTQALQTATKALEDKQFDRFFEASKRAWALACRVYDAVEKTQKDVLFGVLFYIALFVPFAFCMERLLFCYSNIYKRIVAFTGILVSLIAVIYIVHPAFHLAYSPMVVIVAFFIMGLSLMVTLIIFFRFEQEMARLQRRAQHLKTNELSLWRAFVASFMLGVSNLRRRRLRTGLTCVTLIILTFTIMSFTSVKTMRRHTRLFYRPTALYQGFFLKNAGWKSLPAEALGVFFNAFEQTATVVPRVWLETDDRTRPTRIPVRFGDRVFEAQGLVGLSADEPVVTGIDRILVGGRWFHEQERHAILLPDTLAAAIGIDPRNPNEKTVTLWGVPFQVVGIFSGQKLQNFQDLDGEPLTPVTFPSEISMEITDAEMEALESGEDIEVFQSRYQHVPGKLTLMIPYRTLLAAGGQLKGVAIRPFRIESINKAAEDMVDRFGLVLFCGEKKGTFLYTASDTMSYSGVPNIAIPLVISICIVLNTMISSVYERKGEIGIYTSVGLAPSHVSFLFIAEALAFAVISVVLGYLLAQTTASLFAGTALWSGITVNYSSMAGVAAMVLVILVVLISVLYPSRVAAEIAIPDVNRSWKLPEPKNNMLELTLPFLMKFAEHKSIGGYLLEYFQGHQDVSHGIFATGEIHLSFVCPTLKETGSEQRACDSTCSKEACLRFNSRVWLAPFDFGIMQQVEIEFCPASEEKGYYEIKILLIRESGEANAWLRINKGFLNAIRKQLLIWRSLDNESRIEYEKLLTDAFKTANSSTVATGES
ncbi:MAG: M28 family peptidase [Deltaproteobacteria bacterium]|nr:M28 family peptidase [Deltaproteobacteria bacterium]